MRENHILFTGVGRRIELLQAFRQAALKLGKVLKIYGADMAGTAPALAYCDHTRKVCSMKDPAYIDELLTICKQDRIDLVIPTIDTDLLVLSQNKEKFEKQGIRVLISEPNMIAVCRDKNLTSAFFESCGLKAPLPVNDISKYNLGFPAFIKPKDGSSSINAWKASNREELETYAERIKDYVIQPFIDGDEYTIDIFCDFEGNALSVVPRRRLQVREGEVLKTEIVMDERMIGEAGMLLKCFRACGPITVQLIRSARDGEDYFIEINPRFGGGAPLSMKAGACGPEYALRMLDGEKDFPDECIEDGAVYSRFDQSVCVHHGNRRVRGVILDLDDTLYSEKEYVESGYAAVGKHLGNEELYAGKLQTYFKEGKAPLDELMKELPENVKKEDLLQVYRSHKPKLHLYEGVEELLRALRAADIRVGILTDGRPEGQRNKLEALGLPELVDDIIITDELGGHQFRKPCDIAYRILQMRWQLPFEDLVYVGDNITKDFQAPGRLGMRSVYFNNADGLYKTEESGFSVTDEVGDFKQILKLLMP